MQEINLSLSLIEHVATPLRSKMNEGDLIAELSKITAELGGTMERIDGYKSEGRQYKKIVIEYDSKEWIRNEI